MIAFSLSWTVVPPNQSIRAVIMDADAVTSWLKDSECASLVLISKVSESEEVNMDSDFGREAVASLRDRVGSSLGVPVGIGDGLAESVDVDVAPDAVSCPEWELVDVATVDVGVKASVAV